MDLRNIEFRRNWWQTFRLLLESSAASKRQGTSAYITLTNRQPCGQPSIKTVFPKICLVTNQMNDLGDGTDQFKGTISLQLMRGLEPNADQCGKTLQV